MPKLLLIEDDHTLGYALSEYLRLKEMEVDWVKNFTEALKAFQRRPYDICLVDVGLPGPDGFELAREIRRRQPRQPLLFLTARSLKADKLRGFALGADDYLTKPVDEEELVARIQAVLRRTAAADPSAAAPERSYRIGRYWFDAGSQVLRLAGEERALTERESLLLELLYEYRGRILPRDRVLKTIWRQNDYFTRRSMDVFISRLRKYLQDDPNIQIRNVYGSGFVLEVAETGDG